MPMPHNRQEPSQGPTECADIISGGEGHQRAQDQGQLLQPQQGHQAAKNPRGRYAWACGGYWGGGQRPYVKVCYQLYLSNTILYGV